MKKNRIFSHSFNIQQADTKQSVEQLLNNAIHLHQRGQLQSAEQLYKKILEIQPKHDFALNLLGILISQFKNDHKQAEKLLKKAIKLNPQVPDYHGNLALCLQHQNRLLEAEKAFKNAVKIDPEFFTGWFGIGNVNTYLKNTSIAIKNFKKAIACNPKYLPAYNNLGNIYRELKEYDNALAMFNKTLELKPDFAEAWYNMGLVYRFIPDAEKAIQAFDKAIQLKDNYARAYSTKGICYYQLLDDPDKAIQSFDKSITIDPEYIYPYLYKAVIYQDSGHFEDAEKILEKVLQIDETAVGAYLGLVNNRSVNSIDESKLQEILKEESIGTRKKVMIYFTLGKIFNDKKEYDKAFNYYDSGNKLFRSTYTYNTDELIEGFENLKKVFNKQLIDDISAYGSKSTLPVFIVGMPRSGTTLTEQIIASHPEVFGGGELSFFQEGINEISRKQGIEDLYPLNIPKIHKPDFSNLAESYLEKIRSLNGANDAGRITDKLPYNFHFIGLIKALFPNAVIIHCKRNPLDTCLSIYFHHFKEIHNYAYDLVELGNYYNQYQSLMEFWETLFPGQIHSVNYEELIQEPEPISRQLIDCLGLEWNDKCLKFYDSDRSVKTASNWQVRQPIYQSSAGVSQNYAHHIKTLVDILHI